MTKLKNSKIIAFFLLLCFSTSAFGDCDFKTGITPLPDGGYRYSPECHLKVGQLVQDSATKDAQIQDLTKAIQLKDLAVQTEQSRTQLWIDTSGKLEDKLQTYEMLEKRDSTLYFIGGVALTILSVWGASKLR